MLIPDQLERALAVDQHTVGDTNGHCCARRRQAQHFRGIIGMILERRNESLEVYLSTLTPLIGPDLVVLDDRPLTNQGGAAARLL